MNKIFKIIWNKTTQRLEVVSELAKSQGKATASADNRVEVASAVSFKKSILLTAISLALGLSAVSLPAAAAVSLDDNTAGHWGTSFGWKNTIDGRLQDKRWPIVVGRENSLAPTNAESEGAPSSATLMGRNNTITKGLKLAVFGDRNNINTGHTNIVFGTDNTINAGKVGSISTVIGTNNTFTGSNNQFLTAIGNNIKGDNPSTEGVYIGNNVTANSSPIAIGNNVYSEIGGSAIGHNVEVRARTAEAGGFISSDSGFAIGSTINSYGDHLSVGRNIDLSGGKIATNNNVNNKDSVYLGEYITTKTAKESLLVGSRINSNDDKAHYSVGVGSNIVLGKETEKATALGSNLTVNGKYSLGVGTGVNVSAENAIGIGRDSVASKDSASALGLGANATAANATAIGRYARATVGDSVALGREAKAETAAGDVAIGSQSETSAVSTLSAWNVGGTNLANSYATNVKSTSNGVVSVGSSSVRRQIKNVAAGDVSATSTDAVNGAQLYWLSTKIGDTDYVHVKSTETGNKDSANSGATGSNSVAIGPNAAAAGDSGIAIGNKASASKNQGAAAIGYNATVSNNNATAIGRDSVASGADTVALGLTASARVTLRFQLVNKPNLEEQVPLL